MSWLRGYLGEEPSGQARKDTRIPRRGVPQGPERPAERIKQRRGGDSAGKGVEEEVRATSEKTLQASP